MYKQLGRRFWGYTYQDLEKDLEIFARAFPETMELKTLGKTADKREIYCFILGRADAGEKIFLFGAIHGREYMTSQLLDRKSTRLNSSHSRKSRMPSSA